jgi:hypothetical protein
MFNLSCSLAAARTAFTRIVFMLTLLVAGATVQAQTLPIYDDALQSSWQNYSFNGGSDFASTTVFHGGTKSISYIPDDAPFNAVSLARTDMPVTTAEYPVLHFWVYGSGGGGQQLTIQLGLGEAEVVQASGDLDAYIAGGGIGGGEWREVTVELTQAPLAFNGTFDRIDIFTDGGEQTVVYFDDFILTQSSAPPASVLVVEHDVTHSSMTSDRFTWQDSANKTRKAVLAHHNTGVAYGGVGTVYGVAMREFQYQLSNGATRIANITTYGNGGYGGFGYVVSHSTAGGCVGDDSPLGDRFPLTGFQRVFEGRHHAIFRYTQDYPRNCPGQARKLPVTIEWVFSTGRDHPVYAITYDVDLLRNGANVVAPANTINDDSRAPYGELNIDGTGFADIEGVAWGDRRKFTSTTVPLTLNSDWTYNEANSVPYIKEWIAGPLGAGNTKDATMGLVQTQTMDQQDAGGGRDPSFHDITLNWDKTSADGNAGGGYKMPYQNEWAYQANANNLGPASSNNNARLTWRTQWGFLGQTTYDANDGVAADPPGYPKKSYSLFVILGEHSALPIEEQVTQIETVQTLTLSATAGSVVTSGRAGVTRADSVTYAPAGYDHVYSALAFNASGNNLDANIAVGAGTLKHPMLIIHNYTGAAPAVKLDGVMLAADADYYASLRADASELWITLNRNLTGAVNHLEVLGNVSIVPTGLVATAASAAQVDLTWDAVAGALSYEVDRRDPGGDFVQIDTPGVNSFSDMAVAANTSYLYRVRAVTAGGTSGSSAVDLATTIIFTDPAPAGIAIKAVHLTQLRTAVNAVRALGGLDPAVFTDAAPAGIRVKAVHLTQLRTTIDEGRAVLGLSQGGFTDANPAGLVVKAVHITELRLRVQ